MGVTGLVVRHEETVGRLGGLFLIVAIVLAADKLRHGVVDYLIVWNKAEIGL